MGQQFIKLEPQIEQIYQLFKQHGFSIFSANLHYASFGNFEAVFVSKMFKLKFTRDRSQLFIDISINNNKDEWKNIVHVFNKFLFLNLDNSHLCDHPDDFIEIVSEKFHLVKIDYL